MNRPYLIVAAGGSAYLAAMIGLVFLPAPLGSGPFFVYAGIATAAFVAVLVLAWSRQSLPRAAFGLAMLFALSFRFPPALPPINVDNDLIRYLWDGRVQKLGINPYAVRPADESVAYTHTDDTRNMPSARHRTPYPPAAQLFFRFVVTLHDSPRAMKLALIGCDLLVMLVLWRWLIAMRKPEWLTLLYAWNPLVVLEVAHSGHIDVLGALWIVTCAFWLTRGRTALATIAFVLAVTTKVLPIVLAPLFWRRVSLRDAFGGTGLLVLLYLPFAQGTDVLYGVQNVVQHVRFNGPIFRGLSLAISPAFAAYVAVGVGLLVAGWCRWKLSPEDPAAWAWPMAAAIVCAPVVYPWYLLYLTPFLIVPNVLPLIVWSCTVLMTYVVWQIVSAGGTWFVPIPVSIAEYGLVIVSAVWLLRSRRRQTVTAPRA